MDSILTTIKKMLGIAEDYNAFDMDIIMHINSVFADLAQMGVGPSEGFAIDDDTALWMDFIADNMLLNAVKSYMKLRVQLLFDPESVGSSTLASYERQIQQWEWRLNVMAETITKKENEDSTESNTPAVSSHTHSNKKILDTYNKTQNELLQEAKREMQSIVAELKTTVDTAIERKADKATTLSGYGITDAYNKTEIDESLKTITDDLNDVEGILSDSY